MVIGFFCSIIRNLMFRKISLFHTEQLAVSLSLDMISRSYLKLDFYLSVLADPCPIIIS